MTTWQVPIHDDGTGGVVAEIALTGEPVHWAALVSLAEVLGRAKTPITLTFRPYGPPPLFVTMGDASRALGISVPHVTRLVRDGFLPTVDHSPMSARQWPAVMGDDGELRPDPSDPHVMRLIPWEALVDYAKGALERGYLHVGPPARPARAAPVRESSNQVVRILRRVGRALTVDEIAVEMQADLASRGIEHTVERHTAYRAVRYARDAGTIRQIKTVNRKGPDDRRRAVGLYTLNSGGGKR